MTRRRRIAVDVGQERDALEQTPRWRPANDAEALMFDALIRNHSQDYFRVVATAPLYIPLFMSDAGTERQRVVVKSIDDANHLLVFTSVQGLTGYVQSGYTEDSRPDGYATTSYEELAQRRPDPEWRLAINPGQPIDAYVEIDMVMHAALGNVQIPLADQLIDPDATAEREPIPAGFHGANKAEQSIEAALIQKDTDLVIDVLVVSDVLVPTAFPVDPDTRLDDPNFPWRPDMVDDLPTMCVFTSYERLAEVLPADTPTVETSFVTLALAWPDTGVQLVVNLGSTIELAFDGQVVPSFVSWASDLIERVESGKYQVAAEDDGRMSDVAGTGVVVGEHAVDTTARPPIGEPVPASGPVLFQKVLPHDQVDLYLRRAHHRVAGFVHPYESVRDLSTPEKLYEGLGLLHDRTPFHPDDEEVHVLRWYAYCPELYRLSLGGRDEESRAAVNGWIVEPAPFLGSGIAPGTAAAREFKVDSVELPHGAQLCRIDRYGRQTDVASYDADTGTWASVVGTQGWTEPVR
jgi:SseB protein N-terminal domain